MSNRSDFDEFLMFNLKEINESISDPFGRAYALLSTLAAGGADMMESSFTAYCANIELASEVLIPGVAYFAGMGYFTVHCDCGDSDCIFSCVECEVWYNHGKHEAELDSVEFKMIGGEIDNLKKLIES